MKKEDIGQHFFARLGKTHLRPGGKVATDWLLANGDFNNRKKVLEVACNAAATSIEIAKQFGCQVIGIDTDEEILAKAQANIKENGLENIVQVQQVNTTTLPFEDNSFDIIVNEAMLTMLSDEEKMATINEFLRILKPNGFLLTHDLLLNSENADDVIAQLREYLDINVSPLTKEGWKNRFLHAGFRNVETFTGEMRLLSAKDLINDEGVIGAMKIVGNALKPENRDTFKKVYQTFNDPEQKLGFIAVCSQK